MRIVFSLCSETHHRSFDEGTTHNKREKRQKNKERKITVNNVGRAFSDFSTFVSLSRGASSSSSTRAPNLLWQCFGDNEKKLSLKQSFIRILPTPSLRCHKMQNVIANVRTTTGPTKKIRRSSEENSHKARKRFEMKYPTRI